MPASARPAASCRLEKPGRRDSGKSRTLITRRTPAWRNVATKAGKAGFS